MPRTVHAREARHSPPGRRTLAGARLHSRAGITVLLLGTKIAGPRAGRRRAMADLQWRKVLCPVDFSEESRAALRVAADLARRFGAELTLMHSDEAASALQAATSEPGQ